MKNQNLVAFKSEMLRQVDAACLEVIPKKYEFEFGSFRATINAYDLPIFRDRLTKFQVENKPTTVSFRTTPDFEDAALDIYGNAARAAEKLQNQVNCAKELELDDKTVKLLNSVISNLKKRAAATDDPVLQRTKNIFNIIKEKERVEQEERRVERELAAAKAIEEHPLTRELKKLIKENVESKSNPYNYTYNENKSPLLYAAHGKGARKITSLQKEIAIALRIWNSKKKRVEISRFYIDKMY